MLNTDTNGARTVDRSNTFQYKQVVIVGNGPSAITLSYILAGNWPYYNGSGHPVDFLHDRLVNTKQHSLIVQDLEYLSEGLEGRSSNPVCVLFDTLHHPQADLGIDEPSLLEWVRESKNTVDHVVIGRGLPGGSWQTMEGTTLTISMGTWMELPNLTLQQWDHIRNKSISSTTSPLKQNRAPVAMVAQYYADYVNIQKLDKYFVNEAVVTSIRPVTSKLWKVCGVKGSGDRFTYLTPNVVLASGGFDRPHDLNVPGIKLPFVLHSLSELEQAIQRRSLTPHSDPLLILGAGLSAADAIISAYFYGIPIIHVFRRRVGDPNLIFNKLPDNMYPEYHKVHQMMSGSNGYHGYRPYHRHCLVQIEEDRKVRIRSLDEDRTESVHTVSHVLVLIGSRPDLRYMPFEGSNLGVTGGRDIECRQNPIDINLFTHESVRSPGVYALGPLVGDNFVRFSQGGALAIASHLHKQKNSPKNSLAT